MPKLLQINVCSNVLSTGKICEDIAKVAIAHNWESFIAYGRMSKPSISNEIRIGSKFYTYEHYIEHRLFDREGLASRLATHLLIKQIDRIKPDIIHLHNIHDHYLNYPILFRYLSQIDIPVVWTQHDCWAFTGGCMYFDMLGCEQWKSGCKTCTEHRALFWNMAEVQFLKKKLLFDSVKNITFVAVSDWMHNLLEKSVQRHRPVKTIHNGIDLSIFRNVASSNAKLNTKFKILGVASVWDRRKGLDDFIRLSSLLPDGFEIVLVGLSKKQIANLPKGIVGLERTLNVEHLVRLYSEADVFVNPTYSDNFPTTNIEALACGTPVITYRTGGSPEAVDDNTGIVVEQGDVEALASAIKVICQKGKETYSKLCRERAVKHFGKEDRYEDYITLYEDLLK